MKYPKRLRAILNAMEKYHHKRFKKALKQHYILMTHIGHRLSNEMVKEGKRWLKEVHKE